MTTQEAIEATIAENIKYAKEQMEAGFDSQEILDSIHLGREQVREILDSGAKSLSLQLSRVFQNAVQEQESLQSEIDGWQREEDVDWSVIDRLNEVRRILA